MCDWALNTPLDYPYEILEFPIDCIFFDNTDSVLGIKSNMKTFSVKPFWE